MNAVKRQFSQFQSNLSHGTVGNTKRFDLKTLPHGFHSTFEVVQQLSLIFPQWR